MHCSGFLACAGVFLLTLPAMAQSPVPDAGFCSDDDVRVPANETDRWLTLAPFFSPPKEFAGKLGNFKSPLQFADGRVARNGDDWQRRRAEIQNQWTDLLGRWPALIEKPQVEILESTRRDNFVQHRIRFLWTPTELTTGYLLVPDGEGKRPAVLTVYYEPETAAGLIGEDRDFAYQLARRGFVTLSLGTTEASNAKTFALYYPDIDNATVQPLSMLAYAAANAWYVLASRPEVDSDRIGIVGHSFGGKWSLFAGALFDRFAAVAVSDPGIMFGTHPSVNYWEPWYLGWHARPWRKRDIVTTENPASGLYPKLLEQGRDLHELQALLAPRPFLVSGGEVDRPDRWLALNHLIQINDVLGQHHRVGMTNRPDHSPNPESNAVIYNFFEHFLSTIPATEEPRDTTATRKEIPDRLVVLTFDDSARSHYTVVRPLLKDYEFGATFFITEGFDFKDNKNDYMTWQQIRELNEDGFEIGNHTRDHLGITENTVGQLPEQLNGIAEQCRSHGIPAPVTFAWPGNALTPAAFETLRQHGILFARRGGAPEYPYEEGRGFAFEPGKDHPLLIPSAGDARPKWSLPDFVRAAEQARDGRIAVLQFHGAPDTAHNWVSSTRDNFEAYMKYLKTEGYHVIALRDLLDYVDPKVAPSDWNSVINDRKKQVEALSSSK